MAILDTSKRPLIQDRDENVFIGINLPFHRSDGPEGWFASTKFTIDAVKQNVKLLLQTRKGERLMQPNLGLNLHRFLFEPITDELNLELQNHIVENFQRWMPYIRIIDLKIDSSMRSEIGINQLSIYLEFNLDADPRTTTSVQVDI
tara:strand:- start:1218 stop:1655 length:438 start_codon:yes stop_codon:yes gene_type:complete